MGYKELVYKGISFKSKFCAFLGKLFLIIQCLFTVCVIHLFFSVFCYKNDVTRKTDVTCLSYTQ